MQRMCAHIHARCPSLQSERHTYTHARCPSPCSRRRTHRQHLDSTLRINTLACVCAHGVAPLVIVRCVSVVRGVQCSRNQCHMHDALHCTALHCTARTPHTHIPAAFEAIERGDQRHTQHTHIYTPQLYSTLHILDLDAFPCVRVGGCVECGVVSLVVP